MDKSRISRRKMLGLLSITLPVHHASAALCGAVADGSIEDRLLGLFTHQSSAAAIGEAYLAGRSDTPNAQELVDEFLRTDSVPVGTLEEMNGTELRLHVQERVAQDFKSGNVTQVQGWVLSDSELLLYTLAAVAT